MINFIKPVIRFALLLLVLALYGCVQAGNFFQTQSDTATDRVKHDGLIRIGLILPLTSPRATIAETARSFRNAAEMAYEQDASSTIELVIYDDTGTTGGAREAAQKAIGDKVDVILGPLMASSVKEVARQARQAGVPVIAFSTDVSVAEAGVYLMGFLPKTQIEQVVAYSVEKGSRSFALLRPESPNSILFSNYFEQAVAASGARLASSESYPLSKRKIGPAVEAVAKLASGANPKVDTIFIPDGGRTLSAVVKGLKEKGVDFNRVKLIGVGGGFWARSQIHALSDMKGALYAYPPDQNWQRFASAYEKRYGHTPVRITSLAYDAIGLSRYLINLHGAEAFGEAVITDAEGFSGIDGIFRFLRSGANDRAMAIFRINDGYAEVIRPAQTSFADDG